MDDLPNTNNRLSPLKRMKNALKRKDLFADRGFLSPLDAPQLNLPRFETQLEMHKTNGLFDPLTPDRRVVSNPGVVSNSDITPDGSWIPIIGGMMMVEADYLLQMALTEPRRSLRMPTTTGQNGHQRSVTQTRASLAASSTTCRKILRG